MLINELWDHIKAYIGVASERHVLTKDGPVTELHAWLPIEEVV